MVLKEEPNHLRVFIELVAIFLIIATGIHFLLGVESLIAFYKWLRLPTIVLFLSLYAMGFIITGRVIKSLVVLVILWGVAFWSMFDTLLLQSFLILSVVVLSPFILIRAIGLIFIGESDNQTYSIGNLEGAWRLKDN